MQYTVQTAIAALGASFVLAACAAPAAPTATPRPSDTPMPSAATAAPTAAPKPVEPTRTPAGAAPTAAPAQPAASPTADPSAGTIKLTIAPGESRLSYEVNEILFFQGNKFNVAVGTTPAVNGEILLNVREPARSSIGRITIDVSQFKSDSGQRDNRIRNQWLESAKFPTVTIVPIRLEGLPGSYKPGDEIKFKITADTTIRDTTKPLVYEVVARYDGQKLTGTATAAIKMSAFNFSAPDMAGMLKAEDDARLKLEFVAKP